MPIRTLEDGKLELVVLSRAKPDVESDILSKKKEIYGYVCHCNIQSKSEHSGFESAMYNLTHQDKKETDPMKIVTAIDNGKYVYRWRDNDVIDIEFEYMLQINMWRHKNNLFLIILLEGNGTNKPKIIKIYNHKTTKFINFPGFD